MLGHRCRHDRNVAQLKLHMLQKRIDARRLEVQRERLRATNIASELELERVRHITRDDLLRRERELEDLKRVNLLTAQAFTKAEDTRIAQEKELEAMKDSNINELRYFEHDYKDELGLEELKETNIRQARELWKERDAVLVKEREALERNVAVRAAMEQQRQAAMEQQRRAAMLQQRQGAMEQQRQMAMLQQGEAATPQQREAAIQQQQRRQAALLQQAIIAQHSQSQHYPHQH